VIVFARFILVVPLVLVFALPAQAQAEASELEPGGAEALILGTGVTLETDLEARHWSFRIGLLMTWAVTGVFTGLADGSRYLPVPLGGLIGWVAFEWAAASEASLHHADGGHDSRRFVSYAMRLNMAAMSVFMMVAATSSSCNPLDPEASRACFQRAEVEYTLSWRSGLGRIMTRSVNLFGDLIWKHMRGTESMPWQILAAPVINDGRMTGGGVGIQFEM
jgi:hypothetical protein